MKLFAGVWSLLCFVGCAWNIWLVCGHGGGVMNAIAAGSSFGAGLMCARWSTEA